LCGSQDHLQRVQVKEMLAQWERDYPGRVETIFKAVGNISPSQLADRDLFDFASLKGTNTIKPLSDIRMVNL
jgi:tRNA 2-thiocytidine biosynthesis protein TtcA